MSAQTAILTSMLTGTFGSFNKIKSLEDKQGISELMEYADQCLRNSKFKEAIKEYKELIRKYPCAELYNNLALIYNSQKKLDKANETFDKALELDPKNALIWYNVGHAQYLAKKSDDAVQIFEKVIGLVPEDGNVTEDQKVWVVFAYNDLGCAAYRKADHDKAMEYFKKAIEIEPSFYSAQNNLGNVYANLEKYDEALEQYNGILKKEEKFAEAMNGIGAIHFKKNEMDKAMKQFQKAFETDPYCQVAYMNMRTLYSVAMSHMRQQQAQAQVKETVEKIAAEKAEEVQAEATVAPEQPAQEAAPAE